jgi:hypothetical protein
MEISAALLDPDDAKRAKSPIRGSRDANFIEAACSRQAAHVK